MNRLQSILRSILRQKADVRQNTAADSSHDNRIACTIDDHRKHICEAFGDSSDLSTRTLRCGKNGGVRVLVTHVQGMVDNQLLAQTVLMPLTSRERDWIDSHEAFREFTDRFLASTQFEETTSMDSFTTGVASGKCGVFFDGTPAGILVEIAGGERRQIEPPDTEPSIRGPKEGFVESLATNATLLRRRVGSPRLRIEEMKIGRVSKTIIGIVFISGLVKDTTVQEVRSRLERLDVDAIHESGQIEELIEDAPLSLFPTVLRTERPDRVTGNLMEGRVAILVDGTPFTLVVPTHFTAFLSSPEDYYERAAYSSALRLMRMVAFFVALVFPSLYVSVVTFHQELLPTQLILSIASQREGIPFPAVVEALLMELTFELLREAGTRLPKLVGPAISIIGALVLGDAAIRAGLVSPAMVVIVAFTGIASFSIPVYSLAVAPRLLRFGLILLAASLGLFGVMAGMLALLIHLCSLRSLGYPYLAPEAPVMVDELQDALIRRPWWMMDRRPQLSVDERNRRRQRSDLQPRPPKAKRKQRGDKHDSS